MAAPVIGMCGRTGKRKRVSKNKKKNWRKFSDIKDVEESLEEQRLEERTGGAFSDRPDSTIFVLQPDSTSQIVSVTSQGKRGVKSVKNLKLRCHKNLEPNLLIKPAQTRRQTKIEKLSNHSIQVQKKLLANRIVTATRRSARKQRALKNIARRREIREKRFNRPVQYDIWEQEGVKPKELHSDADALSDEELRDQTLAYTKKKLVKLPKTRKLIHSKLPAVQVVHPGASYNPSFDDHQALLQETALAEFGKLKKEARLERQARLPPVEEWATEEDRLLEMSVGLKEVPEDEEEASGQRNFADTIFANPPAKNKTKTKKARRNEKVVQEKAKLRSREKKERQRESEFFRLKSINAEISESEKHLAERQAKREAEREQEPYKTKRLARLRYEEPDMPVQLTDELSGSLRTLKVDGTLLEERFKSFQKRNILAPTERQTVKRKWKKKRFEKKGHREVVE